ncbi:MAG: glyoxalase superfamily protein [Isosphaeraceae bacterium]
MQKVVPALRITNYARSKAYYVEGLGFHVDWEHRFEPKFPVFLQVSRDGMLFYLSEHKGDCQVGGLLHLHVDDVDAWYEELRGRGVVVKEAPSESLEGLRDMTVVDPDGNQIRIATRLKDKGS